MDPNDDESALLLRFRDGDDDAFRELLRRCEPELTQRAGRWLDVAIQRRVSVLDVLQEARLIAFKRRQDLEDRGPGSFRNWLLGIIDMEAKDAIKRHRGTARRALDREVTPGSQDGRDPHHHPGPSPSLQAIGGELEGLARQAIGDLSEDHRQVLQWTMTDRLDLDAVAARLDRSREAARKLHARALRAFAKRFDALRGGSRERE